MIFKYSRIRILLIVCFLGSLLIVGNFTSDALAQPTLTIPLQKVESSSPVAAISPLGDKIAIGYLSLNSFLTASGKEESHILDEGAYISNISFSQDGSLLFVGDMLWHGKIVDAVNGKILFSIDGYPALHKIEHKELGGITASDFFSDGKRLLTGDSEGFLEVWDTKTGEKTYQYNIYHGFIKYLKISSDDKILFVQGYGHFDTFDLVSEKQIDSQRSDTSCISDDCKMLLVNNVSVLTIVNAESGEVIKEFSIRIPTTTYSLALSPDKRFSIIGGYFNRDKLASPRMIVDNETGEVVKTYTMPKADSDEGPFCTDKSILFFPDGRRYLTINDSNAHIWDISDLYSSVGRSAIHK